jgi:hypothetical protein
MSNHRELKIISGGQTGADRAALDFALKHGINCGGWCPAGRVAEDGSIPDNYPLRETASSDPSERTVLNVNDSDGTLIICCSEPDEGTMQAISMSKEAKKPVYIIRESDAINIVEFSIWLDVNKIQVLNVAGPRESNDRGVYEYAFDVLNRLLS